MGNKIKKILKWILLAIGALVLAVGLVIGGTEFWHWYTDTRNREAIATYGTYVGNRRNVEMPIFHSKTTGKVAIFPDTCEDEHPYIIAFNNRSARQWDKIYFRVEVRKSGHSDNIAKDTTEQSADDIVAPGSGYAQCYAVATEETDKAVLAKASVKVIVDQVIWSK